MADGGQDFNLGHVVGSAGEKGDDGSTVWNTSTAPTYANSKYTFNISNLSGKTGLQIAVNDIIFYSTYYYIVSAVGSTTVDCNTRVNIKGSDASVTIVDNLTSTSSTSALSAKQGKVLNDNKVETSAIATSWGGTTSDSKVPSEKLAKTSLDAKQATLVSGTNIKTINNNSILGSGNIEIQSSSVDIATSWGSTLSDAKVPSEKLTKNSLDAKADSSSLATVATTGDYDDLTDKPTIPTKTSDLTNDGDGTNAFLTQHQSLTNYIQKSSTSGLLKNDGTVDTTSYSTFSGSYNDLSNKPTIPSASSTTPSADTTSGSYGSGTSYARSNHTHPKSSLYAEATHTHTKSQITDFPSLSTVATSGSYSDLSNKPSYTATITSSTTGAYEIGKINVSGSSQTIYGKDTGGSSVDIVTAWESTPSDSKVASEKLTKDTLDGKLDNAISSTAITIASNDNILVTDYSDSNKVKRVANILSSQMKDPNNYLWIGTSENATQETINSMIDSEFSDVFGILSNKVSKSSTSGLLKNDGSVDTNTYLTSSAITGMLTTSDVVDNLTSTSATAPLSAKQGKVLNDLIGQAIAYINQ